MSNLIDKQRGRPIEVRFRDMTDGPIPLAKAEEFQRSACDFFAIVQGYRDQPEGGDGTEIVSLVTATIDGRTKGPVDIDTLYNVWLSLAGEIVNRQDDSAEAMKIRRFISMVLQRVQLDENLQRLESLKALHPGKDERELVAELITPEASRDSVLG